MLRESEEKLSWYEKRLLKATDEAEEGSQSSSQKAKSDQDCKKPLPFIFTYFYLVSPGKARCTICQNQKDEKKDFSVGHSHFQNAEKHLARQHKIFNKSAIQKKINHVSLRDSLSKQSQYINNTILEEKFDKTPIDLPKNHVRSRYSLHVFKYFVNINEQFVRCNLCDLQGKIAIYSIKFSTFKNCNSHLQKQHSIFLDFKQLQALPREMKAYNYQGSYLPCIESDAQQLVAKTKNNAYAQRIVKQKRQKNIYKNKSTLKRHEQIITLICKQGVPLHCLETHPFFQETFKAINIVQIGSLAQSLHASFKTHKRIIREKIASRKAKNQKFTLSFSEITIAEKKWLIVCLHCFQGCYFCLGILQIREKIQLETVQNAISNKIYDFEVETKDILFILKNANSMIKTEVCSFSKPHLDCLQESIQRQLFLNLYKQNLICQFQPYQQEIACQEDYIEELMLQFPRQHDSQFGDQQLGRAVFKLRRMLCTLYGLIKTSNEYEKKSQVFPFSHLLLDTKYCWRSLLRMISKYIDKKNEIEELLPKTSSSLKLNSQQYSQILKLFQILRCVQTYLKQISIPRVGISKSIRVLQQLRQNLAVIKSDLSEKMLLFAQKQEEKMKTLLKKLVNSVDSSNIQQTHKNKEEQTLIPMNLYSVYKIANKIKNYVFLPGQLTSSTLQCIVAMGINLQNGFAGQVQQSSLYKRKKNPKLK